MIYTDLHYKIQRYKYYSQTSVCVGVKIMLHCTMAQLGDEYQDLEEVIV